MPHPLEIPASRITIRPTPSALWFWLLAFATALSGFLWWSTHYDISWSALWFLLFPLITLLGALAEFIDARISMTTIDGDSNEVVIERLPRFGFKAKRRRYALKDFVAVESHSTYIGRSLVCRVSLVTADLRALVVLSGSGGHAAKSLWQTPLPAETQEAADVRSAIAQTAGLKDLGYRGTLGMSVYSYAPVER